MNGQEIINLFEAYVDDSLAAATELILLNQAYDRLNTLRQYNYLFKSATTDTVAVGTPGYTLPVDFLYPVAMRLYDSGDDTYTADLTPVAFRNRRKYYNSASNYFIDKVNDEYVFTKTPESDIAGRTIEFDYGYQPDQLAIDTDPVFNRAFHPIIAMEMARFFWYNDQDEKDRTWDRELRREYDLLLDQMQNWDARIDVGTDPALNPDEWLPEN